MLSAGFEDTKISALPLYKPLSHCTFPGNFHFVRCLNNLSWTCPYKHFWMVTFLYAFSYHSEITGLKGSTIPVYFVCRCCVCQFSEQKMSLPDSIIYFSQMTWQDVLTLDRRGGGLGICVVLLDLSFHTVETTALVSQKGANWDCCQTSTPALWI